MFIYEFMGGLVETITGEEDEESYDPHKHRKIEKPTTYTETMMHLLKGSLGAGILAMPDAVSRMGLIGSIVGITLLGIFATYCIQLLIAAQYNLCKRWRRGYMAYPKSMRMALKDGPPCLKWSSVCFPWFVDGTLIVWQLGLCCVYIVFFAQNVKQVFDFYNMELPVRIHICYALIPLLLLNIVKDLKLLTPLSSVSNIVTMVGLILVFFYLIEDDLTLEEEKVQIKSLSEIPIFIGITLFALEAVGVVMALEYNMENPKRFVGIHGLFNIGMLIILLLYMAVGIFGYLKYGEDVQASITLNLPHEQKKAQTAKVVFAVAIFLSFPLQNFVAYNIVWRRIKKGLRQSRHRCADYTLRVMLVIIPWLLAVAVPQLGPFISLFGALCLSLLALIFPALMDLCFWYPDRYGLLRYKFIRDVLIVVIGLFCLFSGCYASVNDIINA